MTDTGIVIVTYNSGGAIGACLDAALRTGAAVVVVDNASVDETVAEVKKRPVRLIPNPTNRGFAAAANQGFIALEARDYVLLLNPDAVLTGTIEPLRNACAQSGEPALSGTGPRCGLAARSRAACRSTADGAPHCLACGGRVR